MIAHMSTRYRLARCKAIFYTYSNRETGEYHMCGTHDKTGLAVLWTRGDRETADTMVYMYVRNAKQNGWWRHIKLIVWGPSARLLAGDAALMEKTKELMAIGVDVEACVSCADMLGVTEQLQAGGIAVKGMGLELTQVLQDEEWAVLSV